MNFLIFLLFISLNACFAQTCQEHRSNSTWMKKSTSASYSDSIDINHIDLDIDLSDFVNKQLIGKATYTINKKVISQNKIVLDLIGFTIDSILINTISTNHSRKDSSIIIDIPPSLISTPSLSLKVYYHGSPFRDPGDWGGFYWDNEFAYNVGVSFKFDPHSFGRAWFPCMDNFVERSTYSFKITTLPIHKAFCNGLLDSTQTLPNTNKVWFWSIKQSIPSYLTSVAVSTYATHEDVYNSIPIQIAVRSADSLKMTQSFVNLKKAVSCFEKLGGPYPFDRIGYCMTPFAAGAMEHPTNITYMQSAVNGTTSNETLLAHELSHMWFGDKATCDKASEMWLNEGFASYCEALFTEEVYGKTAYKDYIRNIHDKSLRLANIDDQDFYPLNLVPSDQTYGTTVYKKGADIVHTLRGSMGDSLFYIFIKKYLNTYAFKDVNSKKLEQALQSTNFDANAFFNGWVYQKGFPHYSIFGTVFSCLPAKTEDLSTFRCFQIVQRGYMNESLNKAQKIEVTFMDNNWNKQVIPVLMTSSCNYFETGIYNIPHLNFKPSFIALDMEEKISDASIDEYKIIKNNSMQNYSKSYFKAIPSNVIDSVLLRVEYSFLPPYINNGIVNENWRLGDHVWHIDGIWDTTFKAKMQFLYNGSTDLNLGYVDNNLIIGTEDSLVLMYRETNLDTWEIANSQKLVSGGGKNDKIGYVELPEITKGYYFLAFKTDTIQYRKDEKVYGCRGTGQLNELQNLAIKIYPVPTRSSIQIEFDEPMTDHIYIFNMEGQQVFASLLEQTKRLNINTESFPPGVYFVAVGKNRKRFILE